MSASTLAAPPMTTASSAPLRMLAWLALGLLCGLVAGCEGNETGSATVSRCFPEGACDPSMFRSGIRAELGDAAAGKLVYEANCARCHGAEGLGLGEARHIDMRSPAWHASIRDAGIIATVRAGRGAAMPAFQLEADPLRDLLAYLRSLIQEGAASERAPTQSPPRGGY